MEEKKFKEGDRVVILHRTYNLTSDKADIITELSGIVRGESSVFQDHYLVDLTNRVGEYYSEKDIKLDVQYYREQRLKDLLD